MCACSGTGRPVQTGHSPAKPRANAVKPGQEDAHEEDDYAEVEVVVGDSFAVRLAQRIVTRDVLYGGCMLTCAHGTRAMVAAVVSFCVV